ncbi:MULTISPECIES: hypothetical protein [unclassified Corynebacterium]
MYLTLFVIATVLSGAGGRENLPRLTRALACYVLFILGAVVQALASGRRLNVPSRDPIALILTEMPRNLLVIMPFALALPEGFSFVALDIIMPAVGESVVLRAVSKIGHLPGVKYETKRRFGIRRANALY